MQFFDLVLRRAPIIDRPFQSPFLGEPLRRVERRPRHDLGVDVLLASAALFPDAAVGLAPPLHDDLRKAAGEPSLVGIERGAALGGLAELPIWLAGQARLLPRALIGAQTVSPRSGKQLP